MEPSYDVLVVGAGCAGMRAAIEAHDRGAKVAVISKLHPTRSHSGAAEGGINAALGNKAEDSPEKHAFDTVKGSDYLGDQDAIEIMCREAPAELLRLEHMGVTFHRNQEGLMGTRAFGGASAARTYYVADITGQAILHVLYEQLMKHSEVERFEEWFTTGLVVDESGACAGAITRNIGDDDRCAFGAEPPGNGGADAARPAGDDGDPVFQQHARHRPWKLLVSVSTMMEATLRWRGRVSAKNTVSTMSRLVAQLVRSGVSFHAFSSSGEISRMLGG